MGATLELVTTGGIQGEQASNVVDEVSRQFPGTEFSVVRVAPDSDEARAVGVEGGVPVLLLDGFPVSRGIPTPQEIQDLLRQYSDEERAEGEGLRLFADRPHAREQRGAAAWARATVQAASTVAPAALFGVALALDLAWPRLSRRGRRAARGAATGAIAAGTAVMVGAVAARELEPRLRRRVVQPNEGRVAWMALLTLGLQAANVAVHLTRDSREHRSGLALGLSVAALAGLAATAAAAGYQDLAPPDTEYGE